MKTSNAEKNDVFYKQLNAVQEVLPKCDIVIAKSDLPRADRYLQQRKYVGGVVLKKVKDNLD